MKSQHQIKLQFTWVLPIVLASLILLAAVFVGSNLQKNAFASITEIDLPVGQGAQEPSLFALNDGRILMSWTEPIGNNFAVKTAIGDRTGWTNPSTTTQSDKLYVNWADFPSVVAFSDGTLASHWLEKNGPLTYSYNLNIALSSNNGLSWSDAIIPHRDGTKSQHGFATLLPLTHNRLMVIWLDARVYEPDATGEAEKNFNNAMQLRMTTISSTGSLSNDTLLDARTCTCCQTSAAITDSGKVIVAYRDRSADEIRDISLLRLVDSVWTKPKSIHSDGWKISGCPVNGPAIDAMGEQVVVAWFTAAKDAPIVNIAFSMDAGETFGRAIRIDTGRTAKDNDQKDNAAGRVDVVQLADGSALVTWVEWTDDGEALLICRVRPKNGCDKPQILTLNNSAGGINFPRMVQVDNGVYIAWTQPTNKTSTIKMIFAAL